MKTIISPEYAALNRQLHEDAKGYGTQAGQDVGVVLSNARENGYKVILDFGCGKGNLKMALATAAPEITVLEFDPAIDGKNTLPTGRVDFVAALDVMEHVEPEYLPAVLETIRDLRPSLVLLKIALTPSSRSLPDGRNAHVLLRSPAWWTDALRPYFKAVSTQEFKLHYIFFGTPREA